MIKRILVVLATTFSFASTAVAHPHVWVDSVSEILFDGAGKITAVRHHWRFDDAFSAFAIQGLDENGDGHYSKAELEPLAEVNVHIAERLRVLHVLVGRPKAQRLFVAAGLLVGVGRRVSHPSFHLAGLPNRFKPVQPVKLEVYDPEYFVAFELPAAEGCPYGRRARWLRADRAACP